MYVIHVITFTFSSPYLLQFAPENCVNNVLLSTSLWKTHIRSHVIEFKIDIEINVQRIFTVQKCRFQIVIITKRKMYTTFNILSSKIIHMIQLKLSPLISTNMAISNHFFSLREPTLNICITFADSQNANQIPIELTYQIQLIFLFSPHTKRQLENLS